MFKRKKRFRKFKLTTKAKLLQLKRRRWRKGYSFKIRPDTFAFKRIFKKKLSKFRFFLKKQNKKKKIISLTRKKLLFQKYIIREKKNLFRFIKPNKVVKRKLVLIKWFKNNIIRGVVERYKQKKKIVIFNKLLPRWMYLLILKYIVQNPEGTFLRQLRPLKKHKFFKNVYITPQMMQFLKEKSYFNFRRKLKGKKFLFRKKIFENKNRGREVLGLTLEDRKLALHKLALSRSIKFKKASLNSTEVIGFSRFRELFGFRNAFLDDKLGVFRFKNSFLIRVLFEFLHKVTLRYKKKKRVYSSKGINRFLKNQRTRYKLLNSEKRLFNNWGFRPGIKPFQNLNLWRFLRKWLIKVNLFKNPFIYFRTSFFSKTFNKKKFKIKPFNDLALFLDVRVEKLRRMSIEQLFCRYLFQVMRYHKNISLDRISVFTVLLSQFWGYVPRIFFGRKEFIKFLQYMLLYKQRKLYKKHFSFFFSLKRKYSYSRRKKLVFFLKFVFTLNNIFCSIRNMHGNVLIKKSAGMFYRGAKKTSRFALEKLTQKFAKLCLRKLFKRMRGKPHIVFTFEGFSKQKRLLKSVLISLRKFKRFFKINRFDFFRKIAHNGVRGRKVRRV